MLALLALAFVSEALAQRARFEGSGFNDPFALQNQPLPQVVPDPPRNLIFPGTTAQPPATIGPFTGGQILPQSPVITGPTFAPGALQQPGFGFVPQNPVPTTVPPAFDPYSATVQPFPVFPRAVPQVQVPTTPPQILAPPTQPPAGVFIPGNLQPSTFTGPQLAPNGGFGLPNRWPYQGTGTNWLPSIDWSWANNAWYSFRNNFLPRVLERPRVRQTWIQGSTGTAGIGNELNINDVEVATTATWPRFLGGPEPLRISPGFIASWWNGPNTETTGADLPARAFSAYLAFDHVTDPSRGFGFDNNLTVGFYSDFDNTSSDALRLTGKLVGWRRINEYMVAKLGVEYFDRIRVNLLPVVGIYANPNPDMKIDLAFPRSKISHRIPNFNNFEAWAYAGGEYGGGSWAIDRPVSGFADQVDINDVRAYLGLEWIGPRRVTGFLEFGYVFERELVFRSDSLADIPIQDSLLLRSGFAF